MQFSIFWIFFCSALRDAYLDTCKDDMARNFCTWFVRLCAQNNQLVDWSIFLAALETKILEIFFDWHWDVIDPRKLHTFEAKKESNTQ